jgi:hypothetical protein
MIRNGLLAGRDEVLGRHGRLRKALNIGFSFRRQGAEFEATALAGKQSHRFKSVYRLSFAD